MAVRTAETDETAESAKVTEGSEEGVSGPAMTDPDDTNVWPTAAEEAAFLSEARGRGEVVAPVAKAVVEEVADKAQPLPKLDEMVERIPAETRELLDELFRAKFVAVRRVKERDLKK